MTLLLIVLMFATVGMTFWMGMLCERANREDDDRRHRGCLTAEERRALGRTVEPRRHA